MIKGLKYRRWLEMGQRRFAKDGIQGININHMSEEMGVAKTSFYFFFNSKEEYLEIIRLKTAVLMSAACESGGLIAGVEPEVRENLIQFGMDLGIAFRSC